MKKHYFIMLFIVFAYMGCGTIHVVSVTPQHGFESYEFSKHLETFLRTEGFIHWSESPDEATREFIKKQIESDKTLRDFWAGTDAVAQTGNESIVMFEIIEDKIINLRFVYQNNVNAYAAQKRAGILAAKLKKYLDLNLPNSQINVKAERFVDLR